MSKKKIIQISLGDGYAGSAKFAILSSIGFKNLGHDVSMIVTKESLTEKRARDAGLKIKSLPSKNNNEQNYALLRQILGELEPEFVIAHHSKERKYLMKFRRQEGRKFYNIAFRNIVSQSFPFFSAIPYNLWIDLNVACSEGVARSLKYRGILPSKIDVVYNGVETHDILPTPISKSELNISEDTKIIGISSWFHPKRKGFDVLFSAISKGLPFPFKILMLGIISDHISAVKEMAQSYNVPDDAMIFPGYVDNIWQYYRAMDVFILPSRAEGFSLSLLEAMSYELPVIASNIPGNNEIIIHNKNGMLFPLKKIDKLHAAIIKIISEPDFSRKLSIAARKSVLEKFTYSNIVNRFDEVLDKLKQL